MGGPSKDKRVTLQDIARRTGVTVNTVSRALKNKPDISQKTCLRIQQVAREMGYVRNYAASSLRSGRTKTLGLILGAMSNPYYAVVADAVHEAASALGYTLMTMCTREDPVQEMNAVEAALGRRLRDKPGAGAAGGAGTGAGAGVGAGSEADAGCGFLSRRSRS